MGLMIGIDGGGTKSIGCIVNEKGCIIAEAQEGSLNYHSESQGVVGQRLKKLINQLINQVACNIDDIDLISIGVAGIGRERDRSNFEKIIERESILAPVLLNTDIKIALVGAHGKEEGLFILSGTGSIAYGIDYIGREYRTGGWGHILGDEGSGYDIGKGALQLIVQGIDQRVDAHVLQEKIFDFLGIKNIDELINFVYRAKTTKADIAGLVPLVQQCAQEGDETSLRLLLEAGDKLSNLTEALVSQMPSNEKPVICIGGGILQNIKPTYDQFCNKMNIKFPSISIKKPKYSPNQGALILGCKFLKEEDKLTLWKKQWKQVE